MLQPLWRSCSTGPGFNCSSLLWATLSIYEHDSGHLIIIMCAYTAQLLFTISKSLCLFVRFSGPVHSLHQGAVNTGAGQTGLCRLVLLHSHQVQFWPEPAWDGNKEKSFSNNFCISRQYEYYYTNNTSFFSQFPYFFSGGMFSKTGPTRKQVSCVMVQSGSLS